MAIDDMTLLFFMCFEINFYNKYDARAPNELLISDRMVNQVWYVPTAIKNNQNQLIIT